jgi:diguanylate cyclase (GGDEF)-like protein
LTDGAAQIAETLRQAVARTPIHYNNKDFTIQASFGVSVGNVDLDTLLKRADASLYKAKAAGRNLVVCDGRVVEKIQGR